MDPIQNLNKVLNEAEEETEQDALLASLQKTLSDHKRVYEEKHQNLLALKAKLKKMDDANQIAQTKEQALIRMGQNNAIRRQNLQDTDSAATLKYDELVVKFNQVNTRDQETLKKLQSEYNALLPKIEASKELRSSLLSQIASNTEIHESVMREKDETLEGLNTELEQLLNNEKELKTDCDTIGSEVESGKKEFESLQVQNQSLTEEKQSLSEENEKIQEKIPLVKAEYSKIDTMLKDHESSLYQLNNDLESHERVKQELEHKLEIMNIEVEDIKNCAVKNVSEVVQLFGMHSFGTFNEEAFLDNPLEYCNKLQTIIQQELDNLTQQKSSLVLEDANLDKQIAECKKQVIDLSLQNQNLDDQFKLAETQIGQNEQNSESFKKLQGDLMEKETLLSNLIAKRESERELQEIAKRKVINERKDDLAKLLQEVEETTKHYEHTKQANHTKNTVLRMKLFKLESICKKLGTEKDNLVQQHLNPINNRTQSKQPKKVSFQSYVTQHCDETDSLMTQDMENQDVNAANKSKQ